MKRNRIIWLILWVFSIVGISFYGGPISYGFFTALTLVPVISIIYLLFVYILFHIYQKVDMRFLVVNDTVNFHFSLVNEYFLLFSGIKVVFFSSFSTITGLDGKTEYELLPGTGIEKDTTLICHYRGQYNVGIKKIEVQDIFRLFKISYKNRECVGVIVKPQLVKVAGLGTIDLQLSSNDSSVNRTEIDVLSHEYVMGDDPRMIDWKQYGRTGALMVRNRIGQDFMQVSIAVELFRKSRDELEYIPLENKVLEILLAVSYYLSSKNINTCQYHFDRELMTRAVGNTDSFEEYYEYISSLSFDDRHTNALLFEKLSGKREFFNSSMVFLILTSCGKETLEFLDMLEKNAVKTVIYFVCQTRDDAVNLEHYKNIEMVTITSEDNLLEVMK